MLCLEVGTGGAKMSELSVLPVFFHVVLTVKMAEFTGLFPRKQRVARSRLSLSAPASMV